MQNDYGLTRLSGSKVIYQASPSAIRSDQTRSCRSQQWERQGQDSMGWTRLGHQQVPVSCMIWDACAGTLQNRYGTSCPAVWPTTARLVVHQCLAVVLSDCDGSRLRGNHPDNNPEAFETLPASIHIAGTFMAHTHCQHTRRACTL